MEIHGSYKRTTHEEAIRRAVADAIILFGQRISGSTQYGSWPWQNRIEIIPKHFTVNVTRDGENYYTTIVIDDILDPKTISEYDESNH